jgi:chromate transporter
MNAELLWQLLREFAQMSLLAFGGAIAVLPEMHRRVVETHGWATSEEFSQLFGLAQAAPGPNLLVVCLIGRKIAGASGALVALVGICGPSSVLAYAVARLWDRQRGARWRTVFANALLPVTLGLTLASAYLITLGAAQSAAAYVVTACSAAAMLSGRVHPLWAIGLGALLGYAGAV